MIWLLLLPALAVVVLLFGGGLVLGILQALGFSADGAGVWTLGHFEKVLTDPDIIRGLVMTFYISLTSTLAAAAASIVMALALMAMTGRRRTVQFIFQLPLTVPHLVIAVAMLFLLSPTGLLSRAAAALGLLDAPAGFPLVINDTWSVGIIAAYVWKEIPFITLMILSALKHGGRELLDVGKTLKATPWQRFRYIVLPTIFPSLTAACLIVFAYTFGAFEVPYLLGRTYPMTLPVMAFRLFSDVDLIARPEGIATGILIAVVVVISVVLSHMVTSSARRRGVII